MHGVVFKEFLGMSIMIIYEPHHEKICPMPYANNRGADQPGQMGSLISTFVVYCLDSIVCLVSIFSVSRL